MISGFVFTPTLSLFVTYFVYDCYLDYGNDYQNIAIPNIKNPADNVKVNINGGNAVPKGWNPGKGLNIGNAADNLNLDFGFGK